MMKILLIGIGNMGKNHLRVINKILSSTEHELKTCDSNKNLDADYLDYGKAIKEYKPIFVIVATTTETHGDILDFCIDKNVPNVFVEKPIIDVGDATKYLGQKNTKIMVGHIERFNPIVPKIKQLTEDKVIDTIICTRSGAMNEKEDFNLHIDLCIHDADVCQVLTRNKGNSLSMMSKSISSNSCNLFFELNGADCFLHADNKSPFKRRDIKIMGPKYFIEGDYLNQTVNMNGEVIDITKSEPLISELLTFFDRKYTEEDLQEAVKNLKIVKG